LMFVCLGVWFLSGEGNGVCFFLVPTSIQSIWRG
jgi:hypothetical protein